MANGMDKKKLLLGSAIVALSGLAADEARAATANIDIDAVVLQAITLAEVSPLSFGTFSVNGADTVTCAPGNAGNCTFGANLNEIAASTDNGAKVKIGAAVGFPIDVSVTAATEVITSGANTMKVNAFKIDEGTKITAFVSGNPVVATLTASPAQLEVGGVLNVGAAQAAGTYTGTFTISAAYQ